MKPESQIHKDSISSSQQIATPGIPIEKVKDLLEIAKAADLLEKFLGDNCGDNDDWPIRITADEEGAKALSSLLSNLHEALSPYRQPWYYMRLFLKNLLKDL
jgi:hypothetical protein